MANEQEKNNQSEVLEEVVTAESLELDVNVEQEQEQVEVKSEKAPMQKPKNKKLRNVLLGCLALLVLAGGGYGAFRLLAKEKVNPFDFVHFTMIGLNGEARLSVEEKNVFDVNIKKPEKIEESKFAQDTLFLFSKNDNLKNGDEIVITLNEDHAIFTEYKIEPTQLTTEYKVEGLKTLPKTWAEVKNQNTVLEMANGFVDSVESAVNARYDTVAQESGVAATISKEHLSTYYKASDSSACINYIEAELPSNLGCGSLAVVYRLTITPPAGYVLSGTDGIIYVLGMATGIHEDGDVTKSKMSFGPLYDELDTLESSEEEVIAILEREGFTLQ